MSIFIARQPIFDISMNVFAYELLYRAGMVNSYMGTDADSASSQVLLNSFYTIGLDKLTNGKVAFINFTDNLLMQDSATLFPKENLVIEILENVYPRKDIIERCRYLKELGYKLALDDFVLREDYLPLIDLADIIKVDFLSSNAIEKKEIVNRFKKKKIKFLAEKVETQADFLEAQRLGYTYYQGFFFSKPVILSAQSIPANKLIHLQLIERTNCPDAEFTELADLIVRDVSLSYKMLRLANSAAFGSRSKIKSIRQALVVLGMNEIRKMISLIALQELGDNKPDEIVRTSLIRAKYAEFLAGNSFLEAYKEECFLLGLFSTLDVLMDRSMEDALSGIALSEDIATALLKGEGRLGSIYQLILSQEQGNWMICSAYADILGINKNKITDLYLEALKWANAIV